MAASRVRLQPQGFLGRLLAQRLASNGLVPAAETNPERWSLATQLLAALQLHDAPGAIVLGEPHDPPAGAPAVHAVAGADERWHDLLHAECVAATVLAEHGVPVAATRLIESPRRSYLLSTRFDRIGAHGRRHVVPVAAVHHAFVGGPYGGWSACCEALARRGRLDAAGALQARALLEFGHLIGNTDMHGGNLGLFVEPTAIADPHFTLAPVYDMLPMRWRPDALAGGAADYTPFEPDAASAAGPARGVAREFWARLEDDAAVSKALRAVAATMRRRLAASHPPPLTAQSTRVEESSWRSRRGRASGH